MEIPDAWRIISVDKKYKIFAQYRAFGFGQRESWRLSSGFNINDIVESDSYYEIQQISGNTYSLSKDREEFGNSFMKGKLTELMLELVDVQIVEMADLRNEMPKYEL